MLHVALQIRDNSFAPLFLSGDTIIVSIDSKPNLSLGLRIESIAGRLVTLSEGGARKKQLRAIIISSHRTI